MTPWLRRWVDPVVEGRADSRTAIAVLVLAGLLSLVYCLWAGRGLTFSGDEFAWVSFTPELDAKGALAAHNGHLVFVSRLLYKAVLETLGTNYVYFRILTLASLYLSVGLFFHLARSRVGDFVALGPCLVLLFFGSAPTHVLAGNGFTILFAISCGLVALIALDRESRRGDLVATAALVLGVLTYTTALPFVAGAAVVVGLGRDRWRRMWIPLIPILVYLAWRLYVVVGDVPIVRGSLEFSNIALTPPWSFQSISGILNSLTGLAGLNYDFANAGEALPLIELAGPVLALAFLATVTWRISSGAASAGLWAALVITLTLFISQVLVWIPEIREPATTRYLFPGAFAVLLVLVEAFRSEPTNRSALIVIWFLSLCGLATNAALLYTEGNALRDRSTVAKSEASASILVASAFPYLPGPNAVPLERLVTDPLISLVAEAESRYGGIGLSEAELLRQSPQNRAKVDSVLSKAFGLGLFPYTGPRLGMCANVEADPRQGGTVETVLPSGGVTVESNSGGEVRLRRFDPEFSTSVGTVMPNQEMVLYIPPDDGLIPWRLQADVPSLAVCALE